MGERKWPVIKDMSQIWTHDMTSTRQAAPQPATSPFTVCPRFPKSFDHSFVQCRYVLCGMFHTLHLSWNLWGDTNVCTTCLYIWRNILKWKSKVQGYIRCHVFFNLFSIRKKSINTIHIAICITHIPGAINVWNHTEPSYVEICALKRELSNIFNNQMNHVLFALSIPFYFMSIKHITLKWIDLRGKIPLRST